MAALALTALLALASTLPAITATPIPALTWTRQCRCISVPAVGRVEEAPPVPTSALMLRPREGLAEESRTVCRGVRVPDEEAERPWEEEGDLNLVLIRFTIFVIAVILAVEVVGLVRFITRWVLAREESAIRLDGQEKALWAMIEEEEDGCSTAHIVTEEEAVDVCYNGGS
ncbi:hypothetical protein H2199_005345 [Coniosporium tulheliwenetii]|uniref:Uncharacterized protein n=1 Tax=Coniosporium tulheliwenetii TaxID=3383036 RepID=A0ACC2Z0Z5_9PEZI|nr:hypothetical protein H2199_005345 [Cladosporium sp. JES 115]